MTPREAAAALIAVMPVSVSVATLEEYGITGTPDRACGMTRELLSLNLFWVKAAIDAHIPPTYRSAVMEVLLQQIEAGWGTTYAAGAMTWSEFMAQYKERSERYAQLVEAGASGLAVHTEVAGWWEEDRLIEEEDRRNVLTLIIDSVPVERYGQLLDETG